MLQPIQQMKLNFALLQLKKLNAQIRHLEACQHLTPAEKFTRDSCEMEKIKLIAEVHTLLKNCKRFPVEVDEILR